MQQVDYIINSAGPRALAFADAIVRLTNAHVAIIDPNERPGGHWNATYPFANIQQDAGSFGIGSWSLRDFQGATDQSGPVPHSSGNQRQILAFCAAVMNDVLLPTGRVLYCPQSVLHGSGHIQSLSDGSIRPLEGARRLVSVQDASPPIPHQHLSCFSCEPDVHLVTAHTLHTCVKDRVGSPAQYCVLGAGRVAMDTILYLRACGIHAERIQWVKPREPWLLAAQSQWFDPSEVRDIARQKLQLLQAIESARSHPDLAERMEHAGFLTRVCPHTTPTMFRGSLISEPDLRALRQIKQVIRNGHVHNLSPLGMILDEGLVPMSPDTLYIDCTNGYTRQHRVPVFQTDQIKLQDLRLCQPSLSAAMIGVVESQNWSMAEKNQVCRPLLQSDSPLDICPVLLGSLTNAAEWLRRPRLRDWLSTSRLDGFFRLAASELAHDTLISAPIGAMRSQLPKALQSLRQLKKNGS